ncbi:MAG: NAD(P)H-dependent oxidoreductase subunit E [Elusimicrobia bacterium]|nr:NAD(P)H-dependent oxidoreductase subunit E [Elusimicrobiota bacterium]
MKSGNSGKRNNGADPRLKRILGRYQGRAKDLISVLQDIQAKYGYLNEEALKTVSTGLNVPLTGIYGVATFYKMFRLNPPGRHTLTLCLGTACHVRGGVPVAEEISKALGIQPGETTKDREYSFDTVNCLGCCAIGPVLVKDGKYHRQVTLQGVRNLLKSKRKSKGAAK